jgi:hypothetical protein
MCALCDRCAVRCIVISNAETEACKAKLMLKFVKGASISHDGQQPII